MYPEEAVQTALDVNTKVALPVHWAGFKLAMHHWKDPIRRFTKEIEHKKVSLCTPQIGELVEFNEAFPNKAWWDNFE